MSRARSPSRIKVRLAGGAVVEALRRRDLDRVARLAGLYEARGADGPRFYRLDPECRLSPVDVTDAARAELTARLEDARERARARALSEAAHVRLMAERLSVDHTGRVLPTPETRRKRQIDVVSKLLSEGRIGADELRAADEIERVFTAVSAGLFARARPLDLVASGGAGSGRRPEMATWLARAYRDRYKPWADRLDRLAREEKHPPLLAIAIASLIDGEGLRRIERTHRLKNGTAARAVAVALELYAVMVGWRTERRTLQQCTAALPRLERLVQPALCGLCGPMECRRARRQPGAAS